MAGPCGSQDSTSNLSIIHTALGITSSPQEDTDRKFFIHKPSLFSEAIQVSVSDKNQVVT